MALRVVGRSTPSAISLELGTSGGSMPPLSRESLQVE